MLYLLVNAEIPNLERNPKFEVRTVLRFSGFLGDLGVSSLELLCRLKFGFLFNLFGFEGASDFFELHVAECSERCNGRNVL